VEGATLLTSLMSRFRHEFDELRTGNAAAGEVLEVPKIKDFDEATRVFSYDEFQKFKNPDWSYSVTPQPARKPTTPAKTSSGPIAIPLAPEVRESFAALAESAGGELEQHVNEALRQWLRNRST